MLSVLQKAEVINWYPYPHIVIPEALPWDLFDELEATFPEKKILKNPMLPPLGEGQRVDLHTVDAIAQMDGLWRDFMVYHTSDVFWHEVVGLFHDAINLCHPSIHIEFGEYDQWTCAPKGQGKPVMRMECQPGINTPQSHRGRVRGPHLDNPVELYGGMLYMGDGEGGNLEIQRLIKLPEYYGKLEIMDDCVETVATVPYERNMLVMFLNTPISIHAVTPRPPTKECRRMVNIAGELSGMLFKTGHGKW